MRAIDDYVSDLNQYYQFKKKFHSCSLFKTAFQNGFFYNFNENPCFTISIDMYILTLTRFSSTCFIRNVFNTTDKTLYVRQHIAAITNFGKLNKYGKDKI